MLEQARDIWDYGNRYCGVELTVQNRQPAYHGVIAKKGKGGYFGFNYASSDTIDGLERELDGPRHIWLVINTDRVLVKKVSETDPGKAIAAAFPGIRHDDFYFEVTHGKGHAFVSACRKDSVDEVLEALEGEKLSVVGFRLGIAPLDMVVGIIDGDVLCLSNRKVTLEDGAMAEVENKPCHGETEYSIAGETVMGRHLLALAGLSCYGGDFLGEVGEQNRSLLKSHREAEFFRKGLYVGIAMLFAVLLVNMFLYSSFYKKVERLRQETELATSQREKLAKRAEDLEKRERLANGILASSDSNGGYYINRIVASMPPSITLEEATYQPLARAVRNGKPIEYNEGVLLVTGESLERDGFTDWLEAIGDMGWAKGITVEEYGNRAKGRDGFAIEIDIDDTAQ